MNDAEWAGVRSELSFLTDTALNTCAVLTRAVERNTDALRDFQAGVRKFDQLCKAEEERGDDQG